MNPRNAASEAILIEDNIPLPKDRKNDEESLPELPLAQMKPGQSFLLETRDKDHTKRKLAAVRSAVQRFTQIDDVASMFRVLSWADEASGKQGVRVFCVHDNEAYKSVQSDWC